MIGILLSTHFLFAQWVQLDQFTDQSLKSVFFTDANTGHVAGDHGTLARTTDGGINWTIQNVGEELNLYAMHFPNKNRGYALGRYGSMVGDSCVLLKTLDAGLNWSIHMIDSSFSLNDLYFMSEDTGYICGYHSPWGVTYGLILKTTDGGSHWSTSETGSAYLRSVHFPSSTTGYVVGKSVAQIPAFWTVLKTDDGGQTWASSTYNPSFNISSVYFTDDSEGYIVGGDNTVLKTTDGGTSWINQDIGTPADNYLGSVFFTDLNTGYIAANNAMGGCVFQTLDGGENWTYDDLGGNGLYALHFPSMDTGYAVGFLGDVFKTTNGGNSLGIDKIPNNHINCRIIPNPVSSTAKIEYDLDHPTAVTHQIRNVNGQVVLSLLTNQLQRGQQQQTFDASCLTPGLYLFTLQANSERLIGKFVIE